MLLSLLALAQPAAAIEIKWWGVGPTVGTVAIPGKYPFAFPANAKDAAGDPLVEKMNGDIDFGVHAVLYPSGNSRFGARGLVGIGIGAPWTSWQLTLEYDLPLVKEEGFQLLAGVGVGAGTERFGGVANGTIDGVATEDGYLVTNYFPVRAQISALLRDKTRAYEINLFGAWHIVADQTYYASENADGYTGAEAVEDGLALVPGALYGKFGIEATVFFGDFRTAKKTDDGGGDGGGGGGRRNR